jgi:hypothetical protein
MYIKHTLNSRTSVGQWLEPFATDFVMFGILASFSYPLANLPPLANGLTRFGISSHSQINVIKSDYESHPAVRDSSRILMSYEAL